MALRVEKSGELTFIREADERLRQKPTSNVDMGLVLLLGALAVVALFFSFGIV
jgi:hypothetical protein